MKRTRTPTLVLSVLIALFCGSERRLAPAIAAPAAASWQFVVSLADPARGLLDVTMTLRGQSGDVRLCLFMENAERHLRGMKRLDKGPAITADDDCWRLPAAQAQGTSLSYQYDLRALADRQGQPDFAQRIGSTYLFNDQAVLLHPDPLPEPAAIEVEFRLPQGMPLITPWARLPGQGQRFRTHGEQHDGGSYIGIGPLLKDLGAIAAGKTVGRLYLIDLPHRASAAALRAWIGGALGAIAGFYGELISPDALIVLVPLAGDSDPGVFGTVVRRGVPSVVIYFGADCEAPSLPTDWLAVHELFHVGNPIVDGKIPWLVEGFTTYYQDILRARARALRPEDAWGDLYDGFRRFCQPEDKVSLGEESQALRRSHRYQRVYWGGACIAFVADAAIRSRSRGQQSLDDVLRELRKKSLTAPIDAETALRSLDAAAGERLVSRLLFERRAIALDDWYRRLGIEPIGPSSVRLLDTAPLAAVRRAMLQPLGPPQLQPIQ